MMKLEITDDNNQLKGPRSLTEKRAREIRQFLSLVIQNPLPYVLDAEGRIDLDFVTTALKHSMNETKGRSTLGSISDLDVNRWLASPRFTKKMKIIKRIQTFANVSSPVTNLTTIENMDNDENVRIEASITNTGGRMQTADDMEVDEFLPDPFDFQRGDSVCAVVDFATTASIPSNGRETSYEGDDAMVQSNKECEGHLPMNRFDRFFGPYPDPDPFAWSVLSNNGNTNNLLPVQTEPLDLSVTSRSEAVVDKAVMSPGKLKTRWTLQNNYDLKLEVRSELT